MCVTACNCTVHKRCHIKVLGRCPGSAVDSSETKVLRQRVFGLYACLAFIIVTTGSVISSAIRCVVFDVDADQEIQTQRPSSFQNSQLHVSNVLRSLRFHALRSLQAGHAMSRSVEWYCSLHLTPVKLQLISLLPPGRLCTECHVNCHKKCQALVPNLCGINQKILAEALETVNKTKAKSSSTSSAHTQQVSTPTHATATKSASVSSTSSKVVISAAI